MDLTLDNGKTVRQVVKELNKEKYYMTGAEFRFIIRNWSISHSKIANAAGKKSPSFVSYWKNRQYIPKSLADIIRNLTGAENFEIMRKLYKRHINEESKQSPNNKV